MIKKEEQSTARLKNAKKHEQLGENHRSNKKFHSKANEELGEEYYEPIQRANKPFAKAEEDKFNDYQYGSRQVQEIPRQTKYEIVSEYGKQRDYEQQLNFESEFRGDQEKNTVDASFLTNDRELMGISEQVPFSGNQGMFQSNPYVPMYPYGMMQTPMPGFISPMGGVPYPVQYPMNYPTQTTIPIQGEVPEKVTKNSEVEALNEEIKRLKKELNESKAKALESQIDSSLESKVRELEEKLKRKEIDTKITEDVLKSEIEALKKRNEVILIMED